MKTAATRTLAAGCVFSMLAAATGYPKEHKGKLPGVVLVHDSGVRVVPGSTFGLKPFRFRDC